MKHRKGQNSGHKMRVVTNYLPQPGDEGRARQRDEHNRDILERMSSGDPLWAYDSRSSWFPPRPTIIKDSKAIGQLYGSAVNPSEGTCQSGQNKSTEPGASGFEKNASGHNNVKTLQAIRFKSDRFKPDNSEAFPGGSPSAD